MTILALDFGGTKHAAAVLADPAKPHWQKYQRAFAPANATAETDLDIVRSLARSVLQGENPTAIGVSFGGPVNAETGIVRLSHHVPGWENVPLKAILEAEFQVPVWVDNDANVAALGEYHRGAGRHCSSLLYITVSTGVGGGWILNGQPWRGREGMAGEIGHAVVDPNGPMCLCGKRGCVERLTSGPYIAQMVQDILIRERSRGKILRSLVAGNIEAITAKQVNEAATMGDAIAIEALQQAGWALGVGIGNAANLLNPQIFVLGGGVSKAGQHFWQSIRQSARNTALPEVSVTIVPAQLGDDAPLWGAVALAVKKG
ncbi:MAG: ROK family protein [Jaaginema sp. PMC 1079.18]|nr:ROK family protein [Jaaginema sp. PMC 1080.18]MEC4851919.1 ROK family protein [Jaaginema sp. PMC 1079.18]MEC4865546.1 ROK family protein [Jaaginema sp. PMC 1078.18]